jgi:hypothetical protein
MQALSIFVIELQTAKRSLLKNFESPDDCRPDPEPNEEARGCEEWRSPALIRGSRVRCPIYL